eukprot:TRINITY_DN9096_c0_g2_i1.p1 TRINITY_DN9096_c0_g2~~TRINITY_DN9096_c0_g2_i1.p1  ORF type:complete len:993 (+),score=167.85 TRINITY_DN9096_c0_g2_i1:57-3035(+)
MFQSTQRWLEEQADAPQNLDELRGSLRQLDQDGSGRVSRADFDRIVGRYFQQVVVPVSTVEYEHALNAMFGREGEGQRSLCHQLQKTSAASVKAVPAPASAARASGYPPGSKAQDLKIWLGFAKLDMKLPSQDAVNKLLYANELASAEDADVIALFVTDLLITKRTAPQLKHLLKNAMGKERANDYVFNEDDHGLLVAHIPCQLVQATEDGSRYVSMPIAVHRRVVRDTDLDGDRDHHDCFPTHGYLTCKSSRRNEYSPTFKSILTQNILLHVNGKDLDLMLLGANLDTNDEAKLGQLEALERLLRMQSRGKENFSAFIWGDFNNRLVAFEEMKPHVKEKKAGKYEITDSGAEFLVNWFQDPRRRHELLQKDALVYEGRDLAGNTVVPPECNKKMLEMFHMTTAVGSNFDIPLPSYKQQPLDQVVTKIFNGTRVRFRDAVDVDSIKPLDFQSLKTDYKDMYFGWEENGKLLQRAVRSEDASTEGGTPNYYMQVGWLDSVAIWKENSACVKARLTHWETEWNVRAFDHLPLRSVVEVQVGDDTIKTWLGFVKLDERRPTPASFGRLLYGSDSASAKDAAVIALFVTDLHINADSAEHIRKLLRRSMEESMGESKDKYIFNEDDPALLVEHIPAQLVKATEDGGARYVAMFVAVKKKHVKDIDVDGDQDHHDCFPEPCFLTCKSRRKNQYEPVFKSILAQNVVLHVNGKDVDLLLLGANFDTDDAAKLGQLEACERMLTMQKRGKEHFCSILWGDFNNRLVAFDGMRPYVSEKKPDKYEITDSGAHFLVDWFADPLRRRELLQKDSLVYDGVDLKGNQYTPPKCNIKLRKMFHLAVDSDVEVPWPSYKVQPLGEMIGKQMGCRVELQDVVALQKLAGKDMAGDMTTRVAHYQELARRRDVAGADLANHLEHVYFAWYDEANKPLQRSIRWEKPSVENGPPNYYMQLGWLDGVGRWKENSVASDGRTSELIAWDTEPRVQAFDHVPLRAVVNLPC